MDESGRTLKAAEGLVAADDSVRAELDRARIGRLRQLDDEIKELERRIGALVEASASSLLSIVGISGLTAARILGEVGDVRRFPTSSTFASVTGTSPIPASSGRTERHRLNRGGNRRLNPCALRGCPHPDPSRASSRCPSRTQAEGREDPP